MIYVATRHKHAFAVHVDVLTTHCASWWLKLLAVLFAMLFLDLDERQALHRFLLCLFNFLTGLSLLF